MGKAIPMHEVNCRVIEEADGNVTLDLATRKVPVVLRQSWTHLRLRRPNPSDPTNQASVKKYPVVLKMPLALAQQEGIA